jgi:hypothetical protein
MKPEIVVAIVTAIATMASAEGGNVRYVIH